MVIYSRRGGMESDKNQPIINPYRYDLAADTNGFSFGVGKILPVCKIVRELILRME